MVHELCVRAWVVHASMLLSRIVPAITSTFMHEVEKKNWHSCSP